LPARLDREYRHQILLRADYQTVQGRSRRGHSIFKDDVQHHVFSFSDTVDVEKFRAQFGGELFDRARRGRGLQHPMGVAVT